jgi:hypothetical protein
MPWRPAKGRELIHVQQRPHGTEYSHKQDNTVSSTETAGIARAADMGHSIDHPDVRVLYSQIGFLVDSHGFTVPDEVIAIASK